ncbi:MAG: leucine-rich repeat domain-containing protein [Proteobacteria bacterium]|nr:leucine-rich repeat domain-containing protein [Pseudomonadota bacterium]
MPPEVGRLTKLKKLSLKRNFLTELPPQIAQMVCRTAMCKLFISIQASLEELDLSENALASLPDELLQMDNLKVIILHGNSKLHEFPRNIAKKNGTVFKVKNMTLPTTEPMILAIIIRD